MASGSQNMTTYLAKGLEKVLTTNAINTDSLLYINTADTNITADMLGATTSIAFTRMSTTGAYTTGHIVWLNAADIGTPFQLVVHDSSDLYLYKRWKSSGTWTEWTKMRAGTADTWTTARTLTIGNTGKSVDGSANVSWSKDEILGASTDAYFLRGDKVWSNTLNNVLLLPKGLKTGARVNDSGAGIAIDTDGGIEIFHTTTPFIDFHYQASTADYSVRLICDSATNLTCIGTFTAKGNITANGGYLYSTLNGNTIQIGSQNGSYGHFTNSKDIPFLFNKVIQSDGGFTIYNTGANHWRNGHLQVNKSDGGDCYIEICRAANADWRILNSSGDLYFQSNWTTAKGSYFTVLQLDHSTGRAHFKEYVYASYFNASCGVETPADGSYWLFANSDGFFRKSSRANIAAKIDLEHKWVRIGGDTMTGDLLFSNSGTTTRQIRGIVGDNDYWRIAGGATAANAGWMEIATADDGNEPVYVRQYTGAYTTIKRTLTLLDASGDTTVPGSLYFKGAGIYHIGSAATYQIIRIIDSGDQYGTGISIGAGGLALFGSGESTSTVISNLSLTAGGTESTYITSDNNIEFYPNQNSYDASARIWMTAGVLNIGTDGNTTRENSVNVYSGAGRIQLFSTAATNGLRGLWVAAHGTGAAKTVVSIDTNNNATFNGNAATATKATQDGSGNTITSKYVTVDTAQTITGTKSWGTSGAGGQLNGAATDGGVNSIRVGNDVWLGDCNQGGIMGMKSTGANTGLYFYNSSGTNTGQFYTNGTNFVCNKPISRAGVSRSWINGRDTAIIRTTSYNGYDAITSMKTTDGAWEMGVYTDNIMYFVYTPDAKYNSGTNSGYTSINIRPNGHLYAAGLHGPLTGDVTGNCSGSSGSCTGNAATATRINGNLAAATSDVNRNIWVSSTASADGIPNYISGFNMNPSTKVFTVPAGTRISPSTGALYLGNSGNQNWVYIQDVCSQDGQKWKIHQNGSAEFTGTVQTGAIKATGDLNLYTSSSDSPDITWWYANQGKEQARIWMGSGGGIIFAPNYRCYDSSGTQLYSGHLVLGNGTGASGTWGISVTGSSASCTGNAATATKATNDGDGNKISTTYAKIAAHNNLTASGNEFTFASSGFSGAIWFNYRTAGGTNGNITQYTFGNGKGGSLASITSGTFNGNCSGSSSSCTGNAATATALKDKTNGTSSYLDYGRTGITDASKFTWLCVWDGYTVAPASKAAITSAIQSSASGSWGISVTGSSASCTGNAASATKLGTANKGSTNHPIYLSGGTPTECHYPVSGNWYSAVPFIHSDGMMEIGRYIDFHGTSNMTADHTIRFTCATNTARIDCNGIFAATGWSDLAEYRRTIEHEPGRAVIPTDCGVAKRATRRLQPGARIVSDTYGFCLGESDDEQSPIALTGRVLAYPYRPISEYHAGDAVCSGPNGTVDLMTREEIQKYPDCIIGIVNEIPTYPIWNPKHTDDRQKVVFNENVEVRGRIWIDVK